ncbi:hypothetical protein CAOG_02398 [Capsaspora owczarzaki ATCC 30864]|uniref:Uncharacterized protein n=1 Tax=Capsaspora owczarzaki (strain ATCC 30864) TaxID=595528 RepID=A0A0D2VM73_CAPO3|nr:hypothetical protein CAOG_02398 [Capsaspora owczarzaki ATCC 30864]KJE91232.1 hypothetical protein CAOG_002398 [Capsaspora owczarzaki ATCC 30864]|eukprot:XP_004349148.1 hypothetical protein CAOG_02398 [Capsaspora owczarzaki ATCC 30864]
MGRKSATARSSSQATQATTHAAASQAATQPTQPAQVTQASQVTQAAPTTAIAAPAATPAVTATATTAAAPAPAATAASHGSTSPQVARAAPAAPAAAAAGAAASRPLVSSHVAAKTLASAKAAARQQAQALVGAAQAPKQQPPAQAKPASAAAAAAAAAGSAAAVSRNQAGHPQKPSGQPPAPSSTASQSIAPQVRRSRASAVLNGPAPLKPIVLSSHTWLRLSAIEDDRRLESGDLYENGMRIKLTGNMFYREGRYEVALSFYERGMALFRRLSDQYTSYVLVLWCALCRNAAQCCLRLDSPEEAVLLCNELIHSIAFQSMSDFERAKTLHVRGVAYMHLGDFAKAIPDIEDALYLCPRDPAIITDLKTAKHLVIEAEVEFGRIRPTAASISRAEVESAVADFPTLPLPNRAKKIQGMLQRPWHQRLRGLRLRSLTLEHPVEICCMDLLHGATSERQDQGLFPVLFGGTDGCLYFNRNDGRDCITLVNHTGPVTSVCPIIDNHVLSGSGIYRLDGTYYCSQDCNLNDWHLPVQTPVSLRMPGPVSCIASPLSADSMVESNADPASCFATMLAYAGLVNGYVVGVDPRAAQPAALKITAHQSVVSAVATSELFPFCVASAGWDQFTCVYDIRKASKPLHAYHAPSKLGSVIRLRFAPQSYAVAAATHSAETANAPGSSSDFSPPAPAASSSTSAPGPSSAAAAAAAAASGGGSPSGSFSQTGAVLQSATEGGMFFEHDMQLFNEVQARFFLQDKHGLTLFRPAACVDFRDGVLAWGAHVYEEDWHDEERVGICGLVSFHELNRSMIATDADCWSECKVLEYPCNAICQAVYPAHRQSVTCMRMFEHGVVTGGADGLYQTFY